MPFPTEVKKIHSRLRGDLANAFIDAKDWRTLFTSQDNVDLMLSCAPDFFADCRRRMIVGLVLGIARMCDPAATSGRKKNLTLLQFAKVVKKDDKALGEKIKSEAKKVRAWAGDLINARHKEVGHRDLGVALGASRTYQVTLEKIDTALDMCADVLNLAADHYGEQRFERKHAFLQVGSVPALIKSLQKAVYVDQDAETNRRYREWRLSKRLK
jgi:hypothetical protein